MRRMIVNLSVPPEKTEDEVFELVSAVLEHESNEIEVINVLKVDEPLAEDKLVCRECGNPTFKHIRMVKQTAIVNSDHDAYYHEKEVVIKAQGNMVCHSCGIIIDSPLQLVTEQEFHEVIANQETNVFHKYLVLVKQTHVGEVEIYKGKLINNNYESSKWVHWGDADVLLDTITARTTQEAVGVASNKYELPKEILYALPLKSE